VDIAALDAEMFYLPAVKREQEAALRHAAAAHHDALAPAPYDQRNTILGELRLRTIPRTEGTEESRARHRKLVDDTAHLPADILRQACTAYVQTEGNRFYPTAGEIMVFANPLLSKRMARRSRLTQMADAAANAFNEADRADPKEIEAILRKHGLGDVAAKVFGAKP